ncbi:MAG: hypothetical protein U0V75_15940 [Ferruginibacter sp.]
MKKLILLAAIFISCKTFAFDTWWHAECTRKAMVANGFSGDARLATQVSNYIADFMAGTFDKANEELEKRGLEQLRLTGGDASYSYIHFDGVLSEAEMEQNWNLLFINTVNTLKKYSAPGAVKPGFRLIVLFNIIGTSIHAVQDFYSHSNWVNLHNAAGKNPVPIWFDVSEADRKKLKLESGVYPDGSMPGHPNHSDLNKDVSARPLNSMAVEAAERASTDWVKRIMDSTSFVPWAELKAYSIQNDMVMKRFLVSLDATFLTSSSIIASHLDGENPVKFIFDKDKNAKKEKAQAAAALLMVLDNYAANMGIRQNEFLLPSPYWSGFKVYFITRDISQGLTLKGKKYAMPKEKPKEKTKPQ